MFEKVNPSHPDKVADRIAGAMVDFAYGSQPDPKIAVEVLIGHGKCHIISESSVKISEEVVQMIVKRIAGKDIITDYVVVAQDAELAKNQADGLRCGDNGIFCGCPVTYEQRRLTEIAKGIYGDYPTDGKYILTDNRLVICQSNADEKALRGFYPKAIVNPLGHWTGGTGVDCGATNRKLGSDMGDAVTGGGLHGKDLSKADVSVNIYLHIIAQQTGKKETATCAIGDECVGVVPFEHIVAVAKNYIQSIGGFERFAEWGLIR